jgi:hypothetical protein
MSMQSIEAMADDGALVPPQGAVFGSVTKSLGPYSQSAGWADDSSIGSQTQAAGGSAVAQYYVYWVNGGSNPYYVVIQIITGSFSPGTPLANGPNSYGFFQSAATVSNVLSSAAATPTLLVSQPNTFLSGSGGVDAPISLTVKMLLSLPSGGGWAPQQFVATEQSSVHLPDWAVLDQSQSATLTQQTCFHQLNPWDPTTNAASQWPYWYGNVYDGNDNTAPPATFSTAALQFEVAVAWMLAPNTAVARSKASPPPPPSLPITLTTTCSQDLAAWHNAAGCLSTFKGSSALPNISGAHHIDTVHQVYDAYTWSVDLKSIVTAGADHRSRPESRPEVRAMR